MRFGFICLCFLFIQVANSQVNINRDLEIYPLGVFKPMDMTEDWIEKITPQLMPEPKGLQNKITQQLDHERMVFMQKNMVRRTNYAIKTIPTAISPKLNNGFTNSTGSGTPNDNHVAVGNNGTVVAVLNTTIRVYDSTGKRTKFWTLENFTNKITGNKQIDTIPNLTRTYDPRVMYCPAEDRYIVFYMHGTTDKTSFIVMGFSTTNNPLDPWNVYKIPGKPTKDSVWSDYPIVSQNTEDVFFTVNLLLNGTSWEEGFTEAVIWQINKSDGFNGLKLKTNLFTNIKYKNKSIWSIAPVQNGPMPTGTDNYFLSVRPYSIKNDTVFLHRITNTQRSGIANYELKILKTDKPYGYPPSALQKDTSYKLRTNDVRVLSGIRVGSQIQYMQNCMNFITKQAHITHSFIYDIQNNPQIRAGLITNDSLDYGYPAIASAGIDENDPSAIITMVHSGPYNFAGTSAMFVNRYGEQSKPIIIKEGLGLINYTFIPKNEQRWGDYEGIQRKYNEPGVYYLIGSFGQNGSMQSWVAKVSLKDNVWKTTAPDVKVFPIPANTDLNIELNCEVTGKYTITLYALNGTIVKKTDFNNLDFGTHLFRIRGIEIATGLYSLEIKGPNGKVIKREKVQFN